MLARRAAGSLLLHEPLAARIAERELGPLLEDIELPLVPVLCAMERAGVAIDSARMGEIAARVSEQVEALEEQAYELAGGPFVLGSPKQLGEVLFERLELPAGRRGKTGYSTDSKVLAKVRDLHPIVPVVEEWRELSKLLSTYLLPFPELLGEDGRLHTTFSQVTAATGRLSAQRPNLQNIPIRTPLGRELRATFVAAPGHRLLSVDYSQVELRILAHLSGEELLREAFERGEDIHAVTAAEVLGKARERSQQGRAQPRQGRQLRDHLRHQRARPLGAARDRARRGAGLHRHLPRAHAARGRVHRARHHRRARARLRGHAARPPPADPRAAGAELERPLARRAPGRQHGHPGLGRRHHQARDGAHPPPAAPRRAARPRLVLQIHDELLLEVPDVGDDRVRDLVVEEMVGAYPLDPPLAVDSGIGDDWLAAKSLENQAVPTQRTRRRRSRRSVQSASKAASRRALPRGI